MIYSCCYYRQNGKVLFDLYSEFITINYIHAVQVIAQHFQFYCRRQVAILKKKTKTKNLSKSEKDGNGQKT